MMYSAWINEEEGVRELSDARGSGSRQGGGPGGGAPWLKTGRNTKVQSTSLVIFCVLIFCT